MRKKLILKIKNFFIQFFIIDDTPHKVAGGAALGIFLGILPGEGLLTTLFFAWLFRLNRLSATAGVLAFNMWATAIILPPAAAIGGFLFRINPNDLIQNFYATYHLGLKYFLSKIILLDLVLPLIAGYLVVAGAIALVLYFLLYYLLKNKKISLK
jgi:uncharacterized protein (DUF2062 family)